METYRPRRHILLSGNGEGQSYTTPPRDMSDLPTPSAPSNRRLHGQSLQQNLNAVPNRYREAVKAHGLNADELVNAYYLTFQIESISDFKVKWGLLTLPSFPSDQKTARRASYPAPTSSAPPTSPIP